MLNYNVNNFTKKCNTNKNGELKAVVNTVTALEERRKTVVFQQSYKKEKNSVCKFSVYICL